MTEHLDFRPAVGFASPHMQTILPIIFRVKGKEPSSTPLMISLPDGDSLFCKMTTPPAWKDTDKTMILIHGLGGSESSSYMIRLSRKFYQAGYRSLRINLRGSGPWAHSAHRPYHAGTSDDVLQAVHLLKSKNPESPITLIGFSLGGNIALKLNGELGEGAKLLLEATFAICPPIDLAYTTHELLKKSNLLYHRYYIHGLGKMGARWISKKDFRSIIDFDQYVTAPYWGYQDAFDYYRQCSGKIFIPRIRQTCHLIFAADDPFVDYRSALQDPLFHSTKIWLSPYGGHMGFWGWGGKDHGYCWLDGFILKLIREMNSIPK